MSDEQKSSASTEAGQASTTTEGVDAVDDTGRRRLLMRLAAGGGAVAAGAIAGAGTAAATTSGGWKRQTIYLDVACLGETWRDSPANYAVDESDFRGLPFSVEGWIYPAGHIPDPGDGFVPSQEGSIGRWMCRGHMLVHLERLEPHIQSSQEFVFGAMAGDELFAADNLCTRGIEGTFETSQAAHRAIVGGTGIYMGASGQCDQAPNGFNTTSFTDGTGSAPNFKMSFDLLLPDL